MELNMVMNELTGVLLLEIQNLIDKYSKISREQKILIEEVLNIMHKLKIESRGYKNLENILELSNMLKSYSKEVLELYICINYQIGYSITIAQAKEYLQDIQQDGYIRVDEVVIYEEGRDLKLFKEDLLENELLTDAYHIERLFDTDTIIEMWLEKTSIGDAADELKHNNIEELLDSTIKEGYISDKGKVIRYIEMDI